MFIYFSFGINYRKRKLYSKELFSKNLQSQLIIRIKESQQKVLEGHWEILQKYSGLVNLVFNKSYSPVADNNAVKLLLNGENKFPVMLDALENAKHHIHLEYYIYDPDQIGTQIINLLIKKASQGVHIRFIYDDFGSGKLRKKHVQQMQDAGIEVFPFYKIKPPAIANRINYRNHRKIVIVDGNTGFVGGINVSDKYINSKENPNKLYWRDTHLMLEGNAVSFLQYIFMVDWNFCSKQKLEPNSQFFPEWQHISTRNQVVQIVASGPDSDTALILQTLCKAISLARKEVLITSPYFIPGETLREIIILASQSGVTVKLLVPGKSDSVFVNMANHAHFASLLDAGVEIFTYQKGFVHAKTLVIDGEIAIAGTANMDLRSFDLNFEVIAVLYDHKLAADLRQVFFEDLNDAIKLETEAWNNRPKYRQLLDRVVALVSPLM